MTRLASILALVVLALSATGCPTNPVGRQCFIGGDAGSGSTIVSSPSLDCQSRTCLRYQGHEELCTGSCESDDDCDKEGEACEGKFVCIVATVVGPFCCKKLCVCEDHIVGNFDGGVPTPTACDPTIETNECCNLEGRRGAGGPVQCQ
jgi:hypothetical protein